MTEQRLCLFDTSLGACGLAWSGRGICGLLLPAASSEATRAALLRRFPAGAFAEPEGEVRAAIDGLRALLAGGRPDLSSVALDLDGVPPFHQRVYQLVRTLGPGETESYGALARRLGDPGAARAVGQALGRNPIPLLVPCHRVLSAGGRPGGFSAPGGVVTKLKLLRLEGATVPAEQGELGL